MIVKSNPKACMKKNSDGNLPLHLINPENEATEIIRILLHEFPQSLFTPNALGEIPIVTANFRESLTNVRALISCSDEDTVRRLLRTKNEWGLSPIQYYFSSM